MQGDIDLIHSAFNEIGSLVESAFKVIGKESEGQIVEMVSVPVEYIEGGIIRSNPHEPPRTETGEYRESFSNIVGRDTEITLLLYTNDPKGEYLEFGTDRMIARNHFDRILHYWEATFETSLGQIVKF